MNNAMGNGVAKIELSEEDAKLFLEFRKYQDTFNLLVQAGVFGIRNGNAILSFNPDGQLMEIDFNLVGFKRGKPILQVIALNI